MDDDEFKRRLISDGVKRLFEQTHVSVCDFKEVSKVANVIPPSELASWWSINHCKTWTDVDPDLRMEIFKRTLTAFVRNRMPLEAVDDCLGLAPAPMEQKQLGSIGFQPQGDGIEEMFDNVVDNMAARVVRSVDERVEAVIEAHLAKKTKPGFLARILGAGS